MAVAGKLSHLMIVQAGGAGLNKKTACQATRHNLIVMAADMREPGIRRRTEQGICTVRDLQR